MSWKDWLGGGVDFITGGLTDFDNKGSGGYNWMPGTFGQQFNPIGGGDDGRWGPSIGTQVGNYPGSADFVEDYMKDNFGNIFGNDGTASPVDPSQPPSKISSSPVRPGSSGSSFQAGSSGISKINDSIFMIDPGYEKMIIEAQLRAQDQLRQAQINAAYAPQQRMAGGGSEGGSNGNGVQSLIKTGIKYGVSQIPVVGPILSGLF
jgi:hypothetical protein